MKVVDKGYKALADKVWQVGDINRWNKFSVINTMRESYVYTGGK